MVFLSTSLSSSTARYVVSSAFRRPALRSSVLIQRRSYILLRTELNPQNPPALPKDIPFPPKTVVLLTTPESASHVNAKALAALTNESSATVFSAVVDSLPGHNGHRTAGHSWLITDHLLPIRVPTLPIKSITFSLPTASFTVSLANTLFQTGLTSTHLHLEATARPVVIEAAEGLDEKAVEEFANAQEDIKEAWEELGELMKIIGQKTGIASAAELPADTAEIKITPEFLQDGSGNGRIFTQLPIRPLTQPRRIVEGMGNILRTLMNGESERAPASRELEAAVNSHRSGTQGKLDVFARITRQKPEDAAPTEFLLSPGTRIHRVLSGGGGWGAKSGLLSLDPQGEPDVSSFAEMFETRYKGGAPEEQSGIVREGEWVQFFAAEKHVECAERGLRFGAVKQIDQLPISGEKKPKTLEGVFGGASEAGVDIAIGGTKRRMDVPGGVVVVDL